MSIDLNAAAGRADPLADDTVAKIVGPWPMGVSQLDEAALARIGLVNRLMATWPENGALATWTAPPGTPPQLADALQTYLRQGSALPPWAERSKVERAERIFMEDGPLSCTLLFCASLPECYVMPNLADVLHIAGQLEAHTEHRIRQTAAMIFPVMMRGGLMGEHGTGLAQVLKVRLIHATIRHLILHGNPASAPSQVPPSAAANASSSMHDALMRHGWDVAQRGLPCNQLELAYTLLTFHFVFLRGMRSLGMGLPPADEESYLHAWNVMGHVLGIEESLLTFNMAQSEQLLTQMQMLARTQPAQPDVRPALGQALVQALARSIKLPILRHVPVPLTQLLIGVQASNELGLNNQAGWPARLLFKLLHALVSAIDAIGRLFSKQFSISRMITRILGYHLLTELLLSQTRPLALPDAVLDNLHDTVAQWGHDRKASAWLNRIEDRWTGVGDWRISARASVQAKSTPRHSDALPPQ
jgi:hypothetical protein